MDFATAVITLAVAGVALLPRLPALSKDGRQAARLKADADLWATMPKGDARDSLGAHIETRTAELLAERARDRTVERVWLYGTAWTAAGWTLLVASNGLNGAETWLQQVRTALVVLGLLAAALGVVLLLAVGALLVWRIRSPRLIKAWNRRRPRTQHD